jgi:hypothetical protein
MGLKIDAVVIRPPFRGWIYRQAEILRSARRRVLPEQVVSHDMQACGAAGSIKSRAVVGGVDSQAWGKSIWWMPWHAQAMKDVARCDKLWWVVSKLWPTDFRMGKPTLTI